MKRLVCKYRPKGWACPLLRRVRRGGRRRYRFKLVERVGRRIVQLPLFERKAP